ncbi:MAG: hypothetical protein EB051_02975, partial [Chlamydiia bacterium]|nr:hypothetical protein [Chlamydiia bacterium]
VGARNVVFVPSAAPTRSERGDGSSGQRGDTSASAPAWGSAAQPSGTTSSFQTWTRPHTTDSANLARAQSIPLSEPLDRDGLRTLQGSVGSRNTTWTRDLSDPHSVPRRTQINEEKHEENGGLNIPGHGVVGIGQGRRY